MRGEFLAVFLGKPQPPPPAAWTLTLTCLGSFQLMEPSAKEFLKQAPLSLRGSTPLHTNTKRHLPSGLPLVVDTSAKSLLCRHCSSGRLQGPLSTGGNARGPDAPAAPLRGPRPSPHAPPRPVHSRSPTGSSTLPEVASFFIKGGSSSHQRNPRETLGRQQSKESGVVPRGRARAVGREKRGLFLE